MHRKQTAAAVLFVVLTAALALSPPSACADAGRPLVAVVGENNGTETTDFVIPYGVLAASGVADVVDVSVHAGPLHLMPALTILAKETIASFDEKHPNGADYVIVPAMHNPSDPVLLAWLRKQASIKATTVGVCDGVWVLGHAGLLDHRNATGHWYSRRSLASTFSQTRWIPDRRYVEDGPIITTTGVTASLPVSLALVERIAGHQRAAEVARELGLASWSPEHHSADFQLSTRHAATAAFNWLRFWKWERIGVPITAGVDEMSLSFTLDALGRTYRSTSFTIGAGATIESKRGLTIVPDLATGATGLDHVVPEPPPTTPPAQALDQALETVVRIYGRNTADFVALQIEYPWHALEAQVLGSRSHELK